MTDDLDEEESQLLSVPEREPSLSPLHVVAGSSVLEDTCVALSPDPPPVSQLTPAASQSSPVIARPPDAATAVTAAAAALTLDQLAVDHAAKIEAEKTKAKLQPTPMAA
jgi:hypothetical protein